MFMMRGPFVPHLASMPTTLSLETFAWALTLRMMMLLWELLIVGIIWFMRSLLGWLYCEKEL